MIDLLAALSAPDSEMPDGDGVVSEEINPDEEITKVERPPMAHKGRRRRRFTEEMVRCAHVTIVRGRKLPCGALLWRQDIARMRGHLEEDHEYELSGLFQLNDREILDLFSKAETIRIDGINDDDEIPEDDETDVG